MKLKSCGIHDSPDNPNMVRLSGEVVYDDNRRSEVYWFDIPRTYRDCVSSSGNPWLACLLPLAVTLGEPLQISKPVDPTLLENAKKLTLIWKTWFRHLHVIPIEADVMSDEATNMPPGYTAAFFSGGVDAFFTVLHSKTNLNPNSKIAIDDLIHVWGFNIPLRKVEAHQHLTENLTRAAQDLNKELVEVVTNLRETRLETAGWGPLYHGSALASVGLVLEKRYQNVLISSSYHYADLYPRGSTPLTDPLFSTRQTKFVHYDSNFGRVEKIKSIAHSEIVRQTLHVCFQLQSDKNCCNCVKCYRTMTTLYLLDVLEHVRTFKKESFAVKNLERIYSYDDSDISALNAIKQLAEQKGRTDIIKAIEKSFQHTKRINTFRSLIRPMEGKRCIGNFAGFLERRLFKNSIL